MKKLIIAVLLAFILSFGLINTAHADKKLADKDYYALLQSKRKAKKKGKATLKSTFVVSVKYKVKKKTYKKI
ncbi:hypothetical protein [Levilactobacillus brevis]|uniref:hypothetical protein n=1 Tax=Levilactobacillus brevis TaxID=1580 RepID=UPI001C1EAF28|nr:hypothetical protein [Levilactobacillus brevis]MBU7557993.1 hypothetical protein [Levilactobacillus brevis]MCE6009700.1 hypothetical protein [Levilactobacillus brevis]MCE6014087.1 hypothetical protein [Levilactobacillus brevis]MCE6016469.1 hypothetical protein [Levilactobacillus brevis]MCE6018872.1 hypothetical protein [Levilactobacillus brevis]